MKKKTRFEWQKIIFNNATSLPPDLMQASDQLLAKVLEDIICAEQTRMKDANLILLTGVTAALVHRYLNALPAPTHVNSADEPVYTLDELAAHLGVSVEEARRRAQAFEREHPDAGITAIHDPAQMHRIN